MIDGGSKPGSHGHRWTVVNYDLLGSVERAWSASQPGRASSSTRRTTSRTTRQRTRHVLRLLGIGDRAAERRRPGRGVPADWHADEQPPARPVQPAARRCATRSPPASTATPCAIAPPPTTTSAWIRNGASNLEELARDRLGRPAAAHQGRGARPAAEGAHLATGRRSPARRSARLEARALDYLNAEPGAQRSDLGARSSALLNRARHELALAKVPATIAAVRERLEADEKVVVFTAYTGVVDAVMEAFGSSARLDHRAATAPQPASRRPTRCRPTRRCACWSATCRPPASASRSPPRPTSIFNDLDWVPGNHWQAEDRIYRIGQTRPAFVTYLYAAGHAGRLRRRAAGSQGAQHRHPGDGRRRARQRPPGRGRGDAPRRAPGRDRGTLGPGRAHVRAIGRAAGRGAGPAGASAARTRQRPGRGADVPGPEQEQARHRSTWSPSPTGCPCASAADSCIAATARTAGRLRASSARSTGGD